MTNASSSSRAPRPGAIALMPRPGRVSVDIRRTEFLVIRRSARVVAPLALCFPGGGIESGESPEDAARREFAEEVGLRARIGAELAENLTPSGAPLHWFAAYCEEPDFDDSKIRIDRAEVAEFQWRTLASLLDDPDFLPNNCEIAAKILSGEIRFPTEDGNAAYSDYL